MTSTPDFHFTRGESQVYRWIEEENPELFARIRAYIDEGRWHVVNGMIIQPDMNIPCGESFVRQVLLGKAYLRDRLGVEPRIAYCVDSFGHAGTLPQILRGCGFDAYVFMRPGPHEKELPANVFLMAIARRQPHPCIPYRRGVYHAWSRPCRAHRCCSGCHAATAC